MSQAKYSDLAVAWLKELGYTHCFFVAGGNNMHLLNAVRVEMECIPFVHEVSAGIAAEYFNASGGKGRAFVMVTAGPGITQLLTAVAGAFLESRELLILGGQVKSSDLIGADGLRQRGIQEIDGLAIAAPVCVTTERLERPLPKSRFVELVRSGTTGRPGPVFLEFCLDVQGAPVDPADYEDEVPAAQPERAAPAEADVERLLAALGEAERPVLLVGGGISRATAAEVLPALREAGIPLMTTWNGMDRIPAGEPTYVGRPNTWGQRSANLLMQQADLLVALGTRLGLQQTGFNWQAFVPVGKVAQVELDEHELRKGHPHVDLPIVGDANEVLRRIAANGNGRDHGEWLEFCRGVRELVPLDERGSNVTATGYVSPFAFVADLASRTTPDDVIVPCSSGGANSVTMQMFEPQAGQVAVTNPGLASMGYGLGGAIGAALAHPGRRTLLVEGDGGFAQNLQELATVAVNRLPLKIFIFANEGYASIRSTQRNYFGGAYVGCDTKTGLGFPEWTALFGAFGIPALHLDPERGLDDEDADALFASGGPAAFIVPIDPEQTYMPKISSRVTETGSMESNPLHHMSPPLPDDVAERVFRYVPAGPAA